MSSVKPQDGGFLRVLSRFKANLSEKEQADFEFTGLADVYKVIDRIQKQQEKNKTLRNLNRLKPFLDAMDQFGKVLDTFANSSQYVAFVWGPLKLLLLTARAWTDAFDSLLEAYEEIAESIPQFKLYAALFNRDSHMKKVLEMIYEDILEFHRRALRFFRLGNLKVFFRASWNGFGSQFKFLIANLERHKHLVESQASLVEYQNSNEARLLAESRFVQSEENEKKRQLRMITEWLSPAEFKSDLEAARTFRGESRDSGRWLFKDKKVSALCDPDSSTVQSLWLVGIPGAGKTVLASTIIEEIQSLPSFTLVYFFCKHKDPHRDNFKAVLRGLVVQLLHRQPDLLPYVYERCTSSGEVTLESLTLLKDLFESILGVSKGVFIILDGIDECDRGEPGKILNCMKTTVASIEENGGDVPKALYISRDEGDIRKILSKGHTRIITSQDNGQDIKQYTTSKSVDVQDKFEIDDNLRGNIVSMVCDRADGMFLYAYLVMNNLLSQTTSQELMDELSPEHFPNGLDQAYGRIATRVLQNPNDAERKQAQRIMGWILCARRPLKWHEIQGATSVDLSRKEVDFERHRVRLSIKDLCGSLIIVDSQDKIEVVHSTARYYLVQQGHFDLIEEHRRLASLTLQYLVLDCFEAKLTDVEMRNFVTQGYYSFAEYALQNWSKHIESCASALHIRETSLFDELTVLLETFINQHWIGSGPISNSSSGVSQALQPFRGHRAFGKLSLVLHKTSMPSTANPDSDKCAVLDLDGILARIRLIIEEIATENVGAEYGTRFRQYYGLNLFKCPKKECGHFYEGFADITSRQKHLRKHERPFFCPIIGCHYVDLGFRSLRELNDHVARSHRFNGPSATDFPAPDPGKTDPFVSISKGNLVALEDFLFSEPEVEGRPKGRANVTRGGKTLLKHAVEKQRVQAVEILLNHGAKPNETGQGSSVTPLYIACEKGLEPIVRLLIDHGAMLNYSTSRGLVPLHRASSFGHTACVQALVTKGAPISDTDHSGHQSLYLALEHKHFETASVLIELGAELIPVVHLLVEDEYRELRESAIDRLGLAGTFGPVLLREAIGKDLTELACSLLERGVDPELPSLHQSLPIAISKGNVALATKLLQKGANPNRPTPAPTSEDRPITMAIRENSFSIAKALLESGALLNDYDILPAHLPLPTGDTTGGEDTFEMVALLLTHGLDVNKLPLKFLKLRTSNISLFSDSAVCDLFAAIGQKLEIRFEDGKTLLHIASSLGYNKTLKNVIDSGLDVNTTCDHKRGALHYAVSGGQLTTADLLLEHQIDMEIRDSKGLTALWLAFEKDDMEMAVKLLHHGADSVAANWRARDSLLHLAVLSDDLSAVRMLTTEYANPLSLNINNWSPLHLAVTLGNKAIIQLLIEKSLCKSGQPSFKARDSMERSLLHLAAQHGQHEIFDLILPLGLGLEDTDINGCTPLHLATNEGREDAVEALLNHGAKINAQTLDGHTSLHFAARKNDVGIVIRLLRHDADPNIPNRNGWMPLHSAVQKGCEEIANLLKFRGAYVSAVTNDGFTVAKLTSRMGLAKAPLVFEKPTPVSSDDLGISSSVKPQVIS